MVEAMKSDVGSDKLSNVTLTVTKLDTTAAAYDYSLTINGVGDDAITVYIKSSENVKAALMDDSSGPWFIKLDTSSTTAVVLYEGIDPNNKRRMRIRVEGTISSDNTFSEVSSVKGFWMQGSSSEWSNLATFTGNPTIGYLGMGYINGANDVTGNGSGNCYLPGGTGTCTSLTPIESSSANAVSLYNSLSSAATALTQTTSSILDFTTIDPTDTDISQ